MIPALPRHEDGVGLYVLDGEFGYQRRRAEGMWVEVQEDKAAQLRRLLAPQQSSRSRAAVVRWAVVRACVEESWAAVAHGATDELLVVSQPLPQLLGLTSTVQRILCKSVVEAVKEVVWLLGGGTEGVMWSRKFIRMR